MSAVKTDHIMGSLLGLALGDALGAPHEGGMLERALWAIVGTHKGRCRWTDDTQMTIDVIESLIEYGDLEQDDLALRFSQSYRWSRGYGPGAAKILKRLRHGLSWESANRSVYPDGSYGNGGAMRTPAVGLFFAADSEQQLINAASDAALVTHAHPLGIEGAVLIAQTTALAYKAVSSQAIIEKLCQQVKSTEYLTKLNQARRWLQGDDLVTPQMVVAQLGNGIAATESCVTAIYIAMAFRDRSFDELMNFTIKLSGDVDTIAAMACAIWGAARGIDGLPEVQLQRLEQYEQLKVLTQSFAAAIDNHQARR